MKAPRLNLQLVLSKTECVLEIHGLRVISFKAIKKYFEKIHKNGGKIAGSQIDKRHKRDPTNVTIHDSYFLTRVLER